MKERKKSKQTQSHADPGTAGLAHKCAVCYSCCKIECNRRVCKNKRERKKHEIKYENPLGSVLFIFHCNFCTTQFSSLKRAFLPEHLMIAVLAWLLLRINPHFQHPCELDSRARARKEISRTKNLSTLLLLRAPQKRHISLKSLRLMIGEESSSRSR